MAIINGDSDDNNLVGTGENDSIDGQVGADTLSGGDGDDTLFGGSGDDVANGEAGNDSLSGSGENDTLSGGDGDDFLSGGDGDDLSNGGAGDDQIFELTGRNTILGGNGVDFIFGGNGNDSIDGGDGEDRLQGDQSQAQAGSNDTINGGPGNDTIQGFRGDDSLTGGPGGDNFAFAASGAGIDRITDFVGGDFIVITDGTQLVGPATAGLGAAVGLGEVQLNEAGGITTLFVGTDSTSGADLTIELTGVFEPDDFSLATNSISLDAAPPSEISIFDTEVDEGDGQTLVFTLQLSRTSPDPISVTVQTSDGTATAGSDYVATSTVVNFAPDQAQATFTVAILNDTIIESDETVIVTLSSPVGGILGAQTTATGLVDDDEQAVSLSVAPAQEQENVAAVGGLVFSVARLGSTVEAASVTVSTLAGSAAAGSDFTATSAVVTVPAGQTTASFTVPIVANSAIEIGEVFLVVLSDPSAGATISPTNGFALGTIFNDDFAVVPGVSQFIPIIGDGADNFLVGSGSSDSLVGGAGNDVLLGSAASDVLAGEAGNDTAIGGDIIVVNIGGVEFVLADDAEVGNDLINVGDGTNFAFAGGGNDTMIGGAGNDLLAAELGNDLIFGGDGDNALYGGDGDDAIQGGAGGDIVFGMFGDDSIAGADGFDLIIEEPAATGGNDFIDAGAGGSQVFAGGGNDIVLAGNGDDFILGESGADRILSGDGDDALIAGPGNDTLIAGAGNDILIAEGGDDLLTGGVQSDVFRYPLGIAVDADRITDFFPDSDTVELAAALGFATGAAASAAVVQQGADAVLTLPGGAGSITFVGLDAGTLTAADFQIV